MKELFRKEPENIENFAASGPWVTMDPGEEFEELKMGEWYENGREWTNIMMKGTFFGILGFLWLLE